MSRIGKKIIQVPEKVEVKIANNKVDVKGPKGNLSFTYASQFEVVQNGKEIEVKPLDSSNETRAKWGLTRTMISNMLKGVTEGYLKTLEFNGVGYKAQVTGDVISLNLGYSHAIDYKLPAGIQAKVVKNTIELTGIDKELVGFAAAKIRSFREPEPYKGKGVKYIDETIIRKAGKTGAKK